MGKGYSPQKMVLGKLDSNMQKNETGSLSYTIHTQKFAQQIKDLNVGSETVELHDFGLSNDILDLTPKEKNNKSNNK